MIGTRISHMYAKQDREHFSPDVLCKTDDCQWESPHREFLTGKTIEEDRGHAKNGFGRVSLKIAAMARKEWTDVKKGSSGARICTSAGGGFGCSRRSDFQGMRMRICEVEPSVQEPYEYMTAPAISIRSDSRN